MSSQVFQKKDVQMFGKSRHILFEVLEPRIMLSGDSLLTLGEVTEGGFEGLVADIGKKIFKITRLWDRILGLTLLQSSTYRA